MDETLIYTDGILWRDQIYVIMLIIMGQYHGKDPWYLEYHGAEIVRDFSLLYLHVYAALLHRTHVYTTFLHYTCICMRICFAKALYTSSNFIFIIPLSLNWYSFVQSFVTFVLARILILLPSCCYLLSPYNTSVFPHCYCQCSPLIVIVVPMWYPYCYYFTPYKRTIVIVVPLHYYCYVSSNYIVTP